MIGLALFVRVRVLGRGVGGSGELRLFERDRNDNI